MFNYIITIHNKQDLLARVLEGVASCCSMQSKIIPVLDGCTDRSEAIVDEFIARSGLNVEKVITPNVYELRAINAGMVRVTEGFIMTIQDDVILQEPELEQKIESLFAETGPMLGIVSPRHAVNVRRMPLLRQLRFSGLVPAMDFYDRVCRPPEAWEQSVRVEYGQLVYRMAAVGSPLIIPEALWRELGPLDEMMAPHMYFDVEYSLRALRVGFQNVVFPLHFESKPEWGTSRKNTTEDPQWSAGLSRVTLRNLRYLWQIHGSAVSAYHATQGRHTRTLF